MSNNNKKTTDNLLEFPYYVHNLAPDFSDTLEARLYFLLNQIRNHPNCAYDDLLAAIELKLLESLLLYQEYLELYPPDDTA